MTRSKLVRMVLVSLVILGLGLVVSPAAEPAPAMGGQFVRSLQRPPFLSSVSAQESPDELDIGEYLDQEAGISAWCQTPWAIDLNLVRDQYKIVEAETEEYIIGSVSVPGYPDHFDVHVYVHVDGWILAYYLKSNPIAKIIDPLAQTINSTIFTTVISIMASAAGQYCLGEQYYDFRYPGATHMLLVAGDDIDGNSYTIRLPGTYGYSDRGWAKLGYWCTLYLDGAKLAAYWNGDGICYGRLDPSKLLPEVTHTVSIETQYTNYGVLLILYTVP